MKEIVDVLKKLQKGYDEKIPENAPALMDEIFSSRQDLLTIGTGTGELCFNRDEVMGLLRGDWDGGWGDFKIGINGAEITQDGDAAWFFARMHILFGISIFHILVIGLLKARYKQQPKRYDLHKTVWVDFCI
ncbi:MAG: nuclear transport factor 2 family protein, partial [Defluviitaleaceae bacterium]|nr:nuclear transport factor 2 family protein [Defluviitaleaceae bacterium]